MRNKQYFTDSIKSSFTGALVRTYMHDKYISVIPSLVSLNDTYDTILFCYIYNRITRNSKILPIAIKKNGALVRS